MAAKGTSIRIFLVDGVPEGLRLIEKSLWTGIGIVCSRNQYPAIRKREEFGRPGIYVLTGPDPVTPGGQLVYIGQAEVARQRLDQHSTGKDFWTHFVLFTIKDTSLNNAHFRYLESYLVQRGLQAKRANIVNGNQPNAPQLSEAEVADAEAFLENMLLIYPLVGVDAFEIVTSHAVSDSALSVPVAEEFFLTSGGVNASGSLTPEGFLVRKDSIGSGKTVPSMQGGYLALRNELVQNGVLVPDGGKLRFTQDYFFKSPSAAAAVALGRSANGRTEWKTADDRTLAEVQEGQIESDSKSEPFDESSLISSKELDAEQPQPFQGFSSSGITAQ